ncbi:hypothetical protein [Hydrogenimonas sp. SS33]|uniref:hypothetical protein n=1 Tax=Hydrogenimonas leucolamina TaxID=2954236 RepID=UPI00336C283D
MKKTIRNLLPVLLLAAVLGGAAAYLFFGFGTFLNFIVAYLCAAIVVGASGFGYWQMVAASGSHRLHHDLPDIVETIDDRYGLWEEDAPTVKDDVKEVLNEERARQKEKRPSFSQRLKNAKPALSLYRLAAYGVLLFGLFWLIRGGRFEPVAYLVGAAAAPLAIAATLYSMMRGASK